MLGIPALVFVGLVLLPDALMVLCVPGSDFVHVYRVAFVFTVFAAPFTAEPDRRGFARPLEGTLVLAIHQVLWYLPFRLLLPGPSWRRDPVAQDWHPRHRVVRLYAGVLVPHHLDLPSHAWQRAAGDAVPTTIVTILGTFLPVLYPPDVAAHTGVPVLAPPACSAGAS